MSKILSTNILSPNMVRCWGLSVRTHAGLPCWNEFLHSDSFFREVEMTSYVGQTSRTRAFVSFGLNRSDRSRESFRFLPCRTITELCVNVNEVLVESLWLADKEITPLQHSLITQPIYAWLPPALCQWNFANAGICTCIVLSLCSCWCVKPVHSARWPLSVLRMTSIGFSVGHPAPGPGV